MDANLKVGASRARRGATRSLKNRMLRWSIVPGLLLAVGMTLYLWFDVERIRADLVAAVEAETGFRVGLGKTRLTLIPEVKLRVEDLILTHPDTAFSEPVLVIGSLAGQLALRPLLSGKIVIPRLELNDAVLMLQRDAAGRSNWDAAPAENDRVAPSQPSDWLPTIQQVRIQHFKLGWQDSAGGSSQILSIEDATLSDFGGNGPVGVAVASTSDDNPWSARFGVLPAGDTYRIDLHDLEWGQNDLHGRLELSTDAPGLRLRGRLFARHLLVSPADGSKPEGQPGRLFSDRPFQFSLPASMDAELALAVAQLRAPPIAFTDLSMQMHLDGGVLTVRDLKASWRDAALAGEMRFDDSAAVPKLSLQFTARDLPLGVVADHLGEPGWLDASGDLAVEVRGSGRSVAAVMAGLDGSMRLLVGKGRADVKTLDRLVGGVGAVLSTLVDEGVEHTSLNCAAASFGIDSGVADGRLLLFDTEHATVRGEGTIDLRTERLDLRLKPEPKTVSINVAVPVKVGGTLTEPTFNPEQLATARKGVGLLAAVGAISFPPAALIGLVELGSDDPNPCLRLAEKTPARTAAAKPADKPSKKTALGRAGDDIGKALGEIGDSLKSLFD